MGNNTRQKRNRCENKSEKKEKKNMEENAKMIIVQVSILKRVQIILQKLLKEYY